MPEGADVGVAPTWRQKRSTLWKRFTADLAEDGVGIIWGGGMGLATTHVETYVVDTLVIDLFDSNTKQLWRGWVTDALPDDPKKETTKFTREIEKLFENFPPK